MNNTNSYLGQGKSANDNNSHRGDRDPSIEAVWHLYPFSGYTSPVRNESNTAPQKDLEQPVNNSNPGRDTNPSIQPSQYFYPQPNYISSQPLSSLPYRPKAPASNTPDTANNTSPTTEQAQSTNTNSSSGSSANTRAQQPPTWPLYQPTSSLYYPSYYPQTSAPTPLDEAAMQFNRLPDPWTVSALPRQDSHPSSQPSTLKNNNKNEDDDKDGKEEDTSAEYFAYANNPPPAPSTTIATQALSSSSIPATLTPQTDASPPANTPTLDSLAAQILELRNDIAQLTQVITTFQEQWLRSRLANRFPGYYGF